MPPDSRADGPGGPKARRTRGPASPGQRTAQPFGGTLNASPPALCVGGIGLPRALGRHSAGRRTRGASVLAGVPRPMQTAAHAGHRPPRGFRRHSAGRRTRGASASRGHSAGLPPHAGHRPPRAFRGPRRTPPTRGIGPRGRSAGLPPPAATHGASALAGVPQASRRPPPHTGPQPSQAFRTPPAARARSQPAPAARFSRKPPCGIGSRMVYCT